jgi:hypothetical protein
MEQRFLSMPIGYYISIQQLKIDLVWDPIRSESDFNSFSPAMSWLGLTNKRNLFSFRT